MILRVFMAGIGFLVGFFLVDHFLFNGILKDLILSSIASFLGGTILALLVYFLFSLLDRR